MRRCPKCSTIYSDDMQIYCLSDGTPLQPNKAYDSEATLVGNIPPAVFPTIPSPQNNPASGQQVLAKRSQAAPLLLMLAAGVAIGLLLTYIFLRPATTTSSQLPENQPANTAPTNMPQTKTREAAVKPSPVKASTPVASSASSQDIRWFVVVGTFAYSDRAGANARLEQMRSEGFRDAYIVDTNSYSNFTPDRLGVVMGPYSESEARRIGSQIRSLTPTIKPGW